MSSETGDKGTKVGSIQQSHLRRRLFATIAVLLVPMFIASAASVYFHQSAAATSRYVLAMGQMIEAVSKLKGHAAQLEMSRSFDASEAQDTYVRALGYYSAMRAADPDGDEIEEDGESATRQALNTRTEEAGIDPIALGTELGLLGHEMPEVLEDVWEEEEDSWEAGASEEVSLENAIGTILLAAAEIFADGKNDPATLAAFWAEATTLSSEQIEHVNAVLTQQSQTAGELPVFLSVLVFVIALFAAVFAWFTVARPLVAEILRIQSELQEEAQAARASDMAKSQFLATISHELRTPMNGVIGAAQLLEVADLPEEDRELIDILNSCADSQMALIEEILTFGEIEAGALRMKSEPIEVKGFMKNATSFATILAQKKDLSFHLEVPENAPEFLGDEKRLRQVIVNLVGNAVKFTDAGSVHVSATVAHAEGSEDAVFSVAVTDTGAGIAPEDQAKIFERFMQADSSSSRKAGGTGLGLSIAQGIAQEANGDITLESEEGKGSTFTLTIPTKLNTATSGASQDKRNAA